MHSELEVAHSERKAPDVNRRVALVTGGSAGLGRALAHLLVDDGWHVVVDGRRPDRLADAARPGMHPVAGDIGDLGHRAALVDVVAGLGRLDLLVNNASTLGPTPLRPVADLPPGALETVWRTNVLAPADLLVRLLPALAASAGVAMSISSDAAVEHYPGWGAYGASKAALDHLALTVAAENPAVPVYVVDPGDLRTELHQSAFPGEDISDRPLPATVAPRLLALLEHRPPSGRYRAAELDTAEVTVAKSAGGEPGTGEPGGGEPGTGEPGTGEPGGGEPAGGERADAEADIVEPGHVERAATEPVVTP
ncbi:MAG: SDR family NAD(P)-dependent oxidoreductase [Dermatophilaceae bacterium]